MALLSLALGGPPAVARDDRPEVVGGTTAGTHEFPWAVRLSVGCSGALVARDVVLTAGHCVRGTGATSSIKVIAGSTWPATPSPPGPATSSGPPASAAPTRATTGRSSSRTGCFDLPTLPLAGSAAYNRGTFTIMGWGAIRESGGQQRRLRKARVPLVSDSDCADAYATVGYRLVPSDMICAGYLDRGGVDTCQGDSGGPMVKATGDGWVQVGIVSWGVGCARAGYPGIYAQVSTFARAITAEVDDLTGVSADDR